MDGGTLGGGILLAALALLWVVVLVPAWARSRQHRVTEQHAARIQRTVRLLAETAEVPEEHIVEASAKEAFKQQKLLKEARERQAVLDKLERDKVRSQQRLQEFEYKKEVRMQRAELRRAKLTDPRLKPIRVSAALAAFFGALGMLVGVGLAIGGLGLLTLVVSAGALLVGLTSLVVLAPGRVPASTAQTVQTAPAVKTQVIEPVFIDHQAEALAQEAARQAYLAQQARAQEARERARAMSRARAGQNAPAERENQTNSILLREVAAESVHPQIDVQAKSRRMQAQEKLRTMGVVGDTSEGAPSLDEVLRRRRNVS